MFTLKKVTKIYNRGKSNETVALKEIDLVFPEKGLILVDGRSGSGKSTLLNLLAGYDVPTSGEMTNPYGKDACSMVFQDFQLIDMLTVEENLKLALAVSGKQADLRDCAELYGLGEVLTHTPNQISGGQKQRTAILRAWLLDRPVLLCDEPTGNLDEKNAKEIAELLKREAKEKLVVCSHDRELFSPLCDGFIRLSEGEVCASDLPPRLTKPTEYAEKKRRKLPFCAVYMLAARFFRKNIAKNILTVCSLFLSFLLLLSSVNGIMNSEASVLSNAYRNEGYEYIDLAKKSIGGFGYGTTSAEEREKILARRENSFWFLFDADGAAYAVEGGFVTVHKVCFAEQCPARMLCGEASLQGGKVVLSERLAEQCLYVSGQKELSSLLGQAFGDFTIGGICEGETPASQEGASYDEGIRLYVSWEDYAEPVGDACTVHMDLGEEFVSVGERINRSIESRKVLYGEYVSLKKGEIGLSSAFAERYPEAGASLIGKTVRIAFYNPRSDYSDEKLDYSEAEFVVRYIFNGAAVMADLSDEDYESISGRYSTNLYSNVIGISIRDYTAGEVKKFVDDGFTDCMALSQNVHSGMDWFRTLYFFELAVGCVLLLLSAIIVCNHILSLIDREKRVLGVLVSLGVTVGQCVRIYLLGLLAGLLLCTALAAVAEVFVVTAFARLAAKIGAAPVRVLFYEPLSVLVLVLFAALLFSAAFLFVRRKLTKKQIADIIYER